jgi:hypothetical protein
MEIAMAVLLLVLYLGASAASAWLAVKVGERL